MVNEDVCSLLKSYVRSNRTVGYNLQIKLFVVSLLLYTPVLYSPVDILDWSIDCVYRNSSDDSLWIPILICSDETTSLRYGKSDLKLYSRLKRADVRPAIRTEFYIKTGLVIMGFSVLFSNIAKFGLYGLGIAWILTPIVILFMWWFGTKVLKIDNKPLVITVASATSVCGTSAAIATGAAAGAKKNDLGVAISISIIFTILMMVFEPMIIKAVGMSELMGGALIGGTVDSTGAVVLAGNALGPEGEQAAVLVKSIQNILIGFIAFFTALFFATHVDNNSGQKVGAGEIWTRFPKFIIGFFVASLVASFIIQPLAGSSEIKEMRLWVWIEKK